MTWSASVNSTAQATNATWPQEDDATVEANFAGGLSSRIPLDGGGHELRRCHCPLVGRVGSELGGGG